MKKFLLNPSNHLYLFLLPWLGCALDVPRRRVATESMGTTQIMWDQMAKFGTGNPQATYESATGQSIQHLFSCVPDFELAQDAAWQGFVDYAEQNVNYVLLDDQSGQTIQVVDEWGARCDDPNMDACGERWSECANPDTCQPQMLDFPLPNDDILSIDIYEPCNFLSNLAYYRIMPQLCHGDHLFMDTSTSTALVQAFGALGFGSAFWHGSHTYLGYQADIRLIDVVAYLDYQMIVNALIAAQVDPNVPQTEVLLNLAPNPRPKTAVELSNEVTQVFSHLNVTDWARELNNLDTPAYELTFTVLIGTVFTMIFPDRPDTVTQLLDAFGTLLGADTAEMNEIYLPTIRSLMANLNISEEERFALFRQLVGMGGKMIFAFLWQEQTIQDAFFLEDEPNRLAADIMEPLFSFLTFISGFEYEDEGFSRFDGMYPGEDICRPAEPHAKWHELSAHGLLDMAFMAECAAAAASGANGGCAHLESLSGLGEVTRASLEAWLDEEMSHAPPLVKDLLPLLALEIFSALDSDNNDKIDMRDIGSILDTVEDWSAAFDSFIERVKDILSVLEDVNCITDSDCDNGDQCIFLSCGKQNDGDVCVLPSDCESNVCTFFTCGLQSQGDPCLFSDDCASGRCDWETLTCAAQLAEDGEFCFAASDCASNRCIWGTCGLQGRGEICTADNQCQSGNCRWTWGGPQCG